MINPYKKSNFLIEPLNKIYLITLTIGFLNNCSGPNSLSRDYYSSLGARRGAEFSDIKANLTAKGFRCERASPKGKNLDETCTLNRGYIIYGCLRRVTFSLDEKHKIISFTNPTEACAGL